MFGPQLRSHTAAASTKSLKLQQGGIKKTKIATSTLALRKDEKLEEMERLLDIKEKELFDMKNELKVLLVELKSAREDRVALRNELTAIREEKAKEDSLRRDERSVFMKEMAALRKYIANVFAKHPLAASVPTSSSSPDMNVHNHEIRNKQHKEQNQHQRKSSQENELPSVCSNAMMATSECNSEVNDGNSWAEVVRHKPRKLDKMQSHQEHNHQRRPAIDQPLKQQQQHQRKYEPKLSTRLDALRVDPVAGLTYLDLYKKIRELKSVTDHAKRYRRTHQESLLIILKASSHTDTVGDLLKEAMHNVGKVSVLTDKTDLVIKHLDMVATQAEVAAVVSEKVGSSIDEKHVYLWRKQNGLQCARTRLTTKQAVKIAGQKVTVGLTVCQVKISEPTPLAKVRCYRCLERGHKAFNCKGVDRSNHCLQCGIQGHRFESCQEAAKCLKCGGPHRIGSTQCVKTTLQ